MINFLGSETSDSEDDSEADEDEDGLRWFKAKLSLIFLDKGLLWMLSCFLDLLLSFWLFYSPLLGGGQI